MPLLRRWLLFIGLAFLVLVGLLSFVYKSSQWALRTATSNSFNPASPPLRVNWRELPQKHPVQSFIPLPSKSPVSIPKIQHRFGKESSEHAVERKLRLEAVKKAFVHSWEGYKKNAWRQDEVSPLSGDSSNPFGGWGATLVDSLDTLWIMGMKRDFRQAVSAVKKIDFSTTQARQINVFETTIRYLGGLLSAYDVSGQKHKVLLRKATELGEMLYAAFDTPNRMPVTRWNWRDAAHGDGQEADAWALLAEVGSLSLEFTRLSQLTGDPKWYDAIARITNVFEDSQNLTKLPGLWPVFLDTRTANFQKDMTFTLAGTADSFYEYFPKQHLLLGGHNPQYRQMYSTALSMLKEHIFFRPSNPDGRRMLMPGRIQKFSPVDLMVEPTVEHLGCFAGGMVALAAKAFEQDGDLRTARELLNGCLWAYESMPSGIMPEMFTAEKCPADEGDRCVWSREDWFRAVVERASGGGSVPDAGDILAQKVIGEKRLAPGVVDISDARYMLRPEAIESLFVLYRVMGDESLQDDAWRMFQAINNATRTTIAHAAVRDVTDSHPQHIDSMESFWTAETLKYFYLIFSEPDVVSLDDYVLNTEAHPLLRPKS